MFPADTGGFYHQSTLGKRFAAVTAGCGFERPELAKFTWHSLRHCFIGHALASGLPVIEVSRLAGQSSPVVTSNVYAHFLPDREEGVRTRLGTLSGATGAKAQRN